MEIKIDQVISHAVPWKTALRTRLYEQSLEDAMIDWAWEAHDLVTAEDSLGPICLTGCTFEAVIDNDRASIVLRGTIAEA